MSILLHVAGVLGRPDVIASLRPALCSMLECLFLKRYIKQKIKNAASCAPDRVYSCDKTTSIDKLFG